MWASSKRAWRSCGCSLTGIFTYARRREPPGATCRHGEDKWTKPTRLHPAFLVFLGFLGGTGAPGEGLVAEEVIAQEASAQLGEEAKDVPDAVHHRQAPQVLFPIKGRGDWKTRDSTSEQDTGESHESISRGQEAFVCLVLYCF